MEFFRGPQVSEDAGEFAHAHVDMEKHEHHFYTPPLENQRRDIQESSNGEYGGVAGTDDSSGDSSDNSSVDSSVDSFVDSNDDNDERARRVAETGKEWATRALNRNDALIYVYRLLLEYARIKDDRREILGWVEDLLEEDGKSDGPI
ncbi:hypothetical protein DM02DRAFT_666349 [Periconia macrospinosa]|uniref:Glycosyl transferase CAP10 domain-containing protein n=1 Tax=Periconia macrospinosa TaxID=97972 RepID=A0A2V1ECX0_9PLEO|nr:hypothetical protein DM02DRAFT_666349 [Periconia macrospinosa]